MPSGKIQFELIDVAPAPILAGLKRLDDRMRGVMKVLGGVLVFRRIAAANVSALQAQSQVDPTVPHFQALLAAMSAWRDLPDLIKVRTRFHGLSSINYGPDSGARK